VTAALHCPKTPVADFPLPQREADARLLSGLTQSHLFLQRPHVPRCQGGCGLELGYAKVAVGVNYPNGEWICDECETTHVGPRWTCLDECEYDLCGGCAAVRKVGGKVERKVERKVGEKQGEKQGGKQGEKQGEKSQEGDLDDLGDLGDLGDLEDAGRSLAVDVERWENRVALLNNLAAQPKRWWLDARTDALCCVRPLDPTVLAPSSSSSSSSASSSSSSSLVSSSSSSRAGKCSFFLFFSI
jgi:hypothetical protein